MLHLSSPPQPPAPHDCTFCPSTFAKETSNPNPDVMPQHRDLPPSPGMVTVMSGGCPAPSVGGEEPGCLAAVSELMPPAALGRRSPEPPAPCRLVGGRGVAPLTALLWQSIHRQHMGKPTGNLLPLLPEPQLWTAVQESPFPGGPLPSTLQAAFQQGLPRTWRSTPPLHSSSQPAEVIPAYQETPNLRC